MFVATWADDSQVVQTTEDVSAIEEGKNAYYDVLNAPTPPRCFAITDGNIVFAVDLVDGHFEINGVPFYQHRQELQPLQDFELVYWRTTEQTLVVGGARDGECSSRVAGYTIGWKARDKRGEEVERTISINL